LRTYERLPEGVRVGYCAGRSNVHVYAALYAAGCPRLAFLLTDLDPRDRLDEELASWKMWLVSAAKHTRRAVEPLEVMVRYLTGEISAETARKLVSKWETVLYEWYEGFLVPAHRLGRLDSDVVEELRGRARKGDLYAAARLSVHAELERLARMAEAGFPDAPRIFDRFIDTLGELGPQSQPHSRRGVLPRGEAEGVGGDGDLHTCGQRVPGQARARDRRFTWFTVRATIWRRSTCR
jgi:hypothetical protein